MHRIVSEHGAAPPTDGGDGVALARRVDEERLWSRHMALAKIGATGRGGVNRQALTAEDCEARRTVIDWAAALAVEPELDAIGNLYLRLPGTDPTLPPVLTGSHLDTQPTGGNFDGIFGVLAGLEVLEAIRGANAAPKRGIDVVVWNNEEGCRFPPSTMGSAVRAGVLSLEAALASTDRDGNSFADGLEAMTSALKLSSSRAFETPYRAYVEAHIEQGPVLERAGVQIGVVTGLQALRQYEIEIDGEEAHAGTTPLDHRKDALRAATGIMEALYAFTATLDGSVRFTVGSMTVCPGSINTVPSKASFTVDVRHPDDSILDRVEREMGRLVERCGPATAALRRVIASPSTRFDTDIVSRVRDAARRLELPSQDILSGATHDAKHMADHCPTGMIFVPCVNGISHNEAEAALPRDLVAGARVLADVVWSLARC